MADGIWVGMSGAVARAAQLEAVADNLANAQTPGFKASHPAFETFLPERADGDENQLAFTGAVGSGVDLRAGASMVTGNPNDVLPDDGGFLSVGLPGGGIGFTRDGRISTDGEGRLAIGGLPVRGVGGELLEVPEGSKLTFDSAGKVLADGVEVGQLATYRIMGPVVRVSPSVVQPVSALGAVPLETHLKVGELEMSNASALESTVQMISAQRNYENSLQAVQTYKRMDDRANDIGRSK